MVRKSDERTVGFNTHPINFVTPSSEMPGNDRWERSHPCGALSLTNSSGPREPMNLLVIFRRVESADADSDYTPGMMTD